MEQSRSLSFKENANLTEHINGREIVSWSIGYDNTLCILVTSPDDRQKARPIGPYIGPYEAWFMRFDGKKLLQETRIESLGLVFPRIAGYPNETFLIASSRRWQDKNGMNFDSRGQVTNSFDLENAIEDIQVTSQSMIWVSYFDEALYPGIRCFTKNGQQQWIFPPEDSSECCADCYSMNVVGEKVWTCYYTEFPVVRIDEDRSYQVWTNRYATHALAVNGDYVAFHTPRNLCVLQKCTDAGEMAQSVEYELKPEGAPQIPGTWPVKARNHIFHSLSNRRWYQLDTNELISH